MSLGKRQRGIINVIQIVLSRSMKCRLGKAERKSGKRMVSRLRRRVKFT